MAVFVNSWPAGVAVSLLILPSIGIAHGVGAVHLGVAAFIACGVLMLAISDPENGVIHPSCNRR